VVSGPEMAGGVVFANTKIISGRRIFLSSLNILVLRQQLMNKANLRKTIPSVEVLKAKVQMEGRRLGKYPVVITQKK
jgi:hypothetical protein